MGNFLPCGGIQVIYFSIFNHKYINRLYNKHSLKIKFHYYCFLISGLSGDRHNSLSNPGRDGSCSGSNGGAIVPTGNFPLSENNGKYDSEALLGKSCGTNNVSSQSVSEMFLYE